ncbi:Mrp/NBP35 family ATP-binding protein [Natrialbaceae archaeon AArc-T1-2]|uniref:Mrp/NBP35 family ATP-binding protein n=1 Tax=Natrialbaceae archaeon AArc-T1-2 TaxID=3053904 RepID=UPI00255AD741|nr:Mrp/NBP35 family ATP-binding protein [Natrialbaceae archaeon AArc-T1-2]WIV68206.1 Mrp/NBP35 family ATP-binding protein [Natrialbaceae archaeon AArc-T1-2]
MIDETTPAENDDVEAAIQAAGVGRDALTDDLVALEAIGPVTVAGDGDVATIPVTIPVPSAELRESLERELNAAVTNRTEIDTVEVDWQPDPVDPGTEADIIPDVTHVIAVGSSKGGVGKSSVAVNLAAALADAGADVGLLDADVYGPNAPTMLGLSERAPEPTLDDQMVPQEAYGINVMSMGFVTEEDDPVIWRGPLVTDFIKQLFDDVEWGSLDYLFVDLPPGTGDAHLALVQSLPVTGAVIVTTPQDVAVADAKRALEGFVDYDVPILGIVENMSTFACDDCGTVHDIFGTGGGERLAGEFDVPVLGQIPIDSELGTVEQDGAGAPGIDIPLLGRLQLPQTERERRQQETVAPIAIRDDGGQARHAFRRLAGRTAGRINAAATLLESSNSQPRASDQVTE